MIDKILNYLADCFFLMLTGVIFLVVFAFTTSDIFFIQVVGGAIGLLMPIFIRSYFGIDVK